jgi:hypothetical protein
MKFFGFITTVIFGITFFSSCQKEVSTDIPDGRVQGGDSIYIKQLVTLDTTKPSGQDTVYNVVLEYDNQKRAVQLTSWFYGAPNSVTYIRRFYNGNDTLPFKSITGRTPTFSSSSDTTFYTYSNGLLVRDSVIGLNTAGNVVNIESRNFTITGNDVLLVGRSYASYDPASLLYSNTALYTRTLSNGNIVLQETSSTAVYLFLITDQRTVAVYDNHPNPLYRVDFQQPLIDEGAQQKNNTLQFTTSDLSGLGSSTTNYSFRYRSDGYPLSSVYTSAGRTLKDLYFYTN